MTPDDSSYPAALKALASPPDLTTSRDLPVGLTAIAIVGTREPIPEARELAYELGRAVAAAGAVVVSGGAVGIDRAAHEGALAADGVTLAVVGTGKDHVFPAEHADLYERIAASRGAMVWPFPDDRGPRTAGFLRRNGVLVALSACQREPVVIDRPVRLNTLGACPVAADKAYALLYSHGDFEPQTSHVESLYLRDAGRLLTGFRTDVRAVVADVSQPGQSSGFLGVSRVPGAGPIDLLLLPRGEACAVSAPIERRSGGTLAAIDDAHVLYAGGITDGGQVPRTYLADLAKGTVTALPFGLGARRIAPTITSFDRGSRGLDRGALVAGGTDPVGNVPLRSAEVYVPGPDGAPGDFEREKIELNDARAEHAAVTLTSGATLLVGGRGPQGLLTTLEVIEPTGRSRIEGLGDWLRACGDWVTEERLLRPGTPRRNWKNTLLSDGYVHVRHPEYREAHRMAFMAATNIRMYAEP
jgi:hypothetical protein